VGTLAAGEDAHALWPAGQLVAVWSFAQQPGQPGHVRFGDLAPRMCAAGVGAGLIRAAFPVAQFPADGVDQLMPGPPRQLIEPPDEPVAGPGAIAGDH
jgi:hypothetical protein